MVLSLQQAEQRLRRAVQRANRSRIGRLALHPWKLAYPQVLLKIGVCHARPAKTFWGGRLDIVLPEAVSTQIWRYGFFEDDVCLFLLRSLRPGMVVLDVGAHFGFFTLLASELVGAEGRIVAVEPMPETFGRLARNAAIHGSHDNITAINSAAYSTRTTLSFDDYGPVYSAFDSAFGARSASRLRLHRQVGVDACTCDELVNSLALRRVDVIKIDAESSEMHVLRGAERTIDQFHPRIIVEVGDFDLAGVASSGELVRSLLASGYRAYERSQYDVCLHEPRATYAYGNLLFVHHETPGAF
jgi:FkbM family methyltransferase